ncbi:MAG: hydroxymethylbilane synthase [Methanospirillaceae archaeon]|nr:hydroxymethylbilane synthase [Methanospirillaceae archaeon]
MPVRIGTRGSRLALAQASTVSRLLEEKGVETSLVIVSTAGDETTGVPLHAIGGSGVFVRALDDALTRREIDIAVHSMKDIPAERPFNLTIGAILPRDSPADLLVSEKELDQITIIGTSSTRRTAQVRRHLPGTVVRSLRGNVDTRLLKLRNNEYDAIILAEAGAERLNLSLPGTRLNPEKYVPSPNQGTVAVVCRQESGIESVISLIDDPGTREDTMIERAVMEQIEAGCFTPLGVYVKDRYLIAEVLSLDGVEQYRVEEKVTGFLQAEEIGKEIRQGASHLIEDAYQQLGISR